MLYRGSGIVTSELVFLCHLVSSLSSFGHSSLTGHELYQAADTVYVCFTLTVIVSFDFHLDWAERSSKAHCWVCLQGRLQEPMCHEDCHLISCIIGQFITTGDCRSGRAVESKAG